MFILSHPTTKAAFKFLHMDLFKIPAQQHNSLLSETGKNICLSLVQQELCHYELQSDKSKANETSSFLPQSSK